MYVEKTPNGKYNLMQISETVFNELLCLLNFSCQEYEPMPDKEVCDLARMMRTESDVSPSIIKK